MSCCLSTISIIRTRQSGTAPQHHRDDILLLASDGIVAGRRCPEILLLESKFFLYARYGVLSIENTGVEVAKSIVCVDMPMLNVHVDLVKIVLQGLCRPRFVDDAQCRHAM
jgi:hypothetical protein